MAMNGSNRDNADAARAAAAASDLPNVRERNLRSADAYDAMADREQRNAADTKVRVAETSARKAAEAS